MSVPISSTLVISTVFICFSCLSLLSLTIGYVVQYVSAP